MSDLHGVSRKLYISIEIVFWLIKYLLKLVTFLVKIAQKWWKWPKRLCQYFLEDYRYDCNCFPRLFYTRWATSHPSIMAVNMILQNPPLILVNSCLFLAFFGRFWHIKHQISKFSQRLLTKNLENVCHALKSPHPKYHVNIITHKKFDSEGLAVGEPLLK